jgi:hypothetical protein
MNIHVTKMYGTMNIKIYFKLLYFLSLFYCFTSFAFRFVCSVICVVSPYACYCTLSFVYKNKAHSNCSKQISYRIECATYRKLKHKILNTTRYKEIVKTPR